MERKLITVAVATAMGLPMAADAVEGSVYGHVNRAVVIVNQDGHEADGNAVHRGNDSSQTRFGFRGSGELDNGLTASVNLEYGVGVVDRSLSNRQAHVSLSTPGGKLTLGHGSDAADSMAHARLGGPSWLAGVTNWCSYTTSGAVTGGPGCKTHDGGRRAGVRYDTPAIGPLSVAASVADDDFWASQVRLTGSFGDSGYALHVGYIGDNGKDEDVVGVSGAIKFPQGTAIAASWGQNEDADTESSHVEIDHSYGAGSIGVAFRQGEDGGAEGSTWAVGVGHGLGNGVHAFGGVRFIEGDDMEDVSMYFAGMRVAFN